MSKQLQRPAVVLLVEDDPGDQELTRRALKEDVLKTDLRVVNDGEEAMDYLLRRGEYADPSKSPKPHIVLLDLNMPRMDGRQVLEQIRSDSKLRRIPVVVLTTSKQDEDIIRSYDCGCNAFLVKPVEMPDFIRVIRELERFWLELVALPPN